MYTPVNYQMVTATLVEGEVQFPTQEAFLEATTVGFFRIKAPEEMDLNVGRAFAQTFTSNPRYHQFGALDVVNGYLQSEQNQTVRFSLERDNWNKCHVNKEEVDGVRHTVSVTATGSHGFLYKVERNELFKSTYFCGRR